ncbi:MAG: sulfatase-like hydrolase/transferase [Alteraurantiacibacter sp.]
MTYDHIILVSVDTLRADAIEATPDNFLAKKFAIWNRPQTPLLNKLAQEGAYFSKTIVPAPYTSSSHASYFTGLWPRRHGLFEFYNGQLSAPSLFTTARKQGYKTIFKTDFPVILGNYLGFNADIDNYIVEDDDAFLDALSKTPNSVSFVHFGGVHLPYGFHNLSFGGTAYRDKVEALRRETGIDTIDAVDQLVETYRSTEDLQLLLTYKTATEFFYLREDYDRLMNLYTEGVSFFMKHRFEPFMERLMRIADKTRSLIVVFGDHGEEYDAQSRGHYDSINEGVLRTPMILWGPGVAPMQSDARVRSIDLAPTLYDLLGWQPEETLDGQSLVDALCGHQSVALGDRAAFSQTYVCDAGEFLDVQKKTLSPDASPVHLRYVLYKERAWSGSNRVTRQFHAYKDRATFDTLHAIEPVVVSDRLGPDGMYHVIERHHDAMLSDLNRYGRLRCKHTVRSTAPPEQVRTHLRAMGYRI